MDDALSKVGLQRVDDVMAAHVERGELPGLALLISRRGHVHTCAIGSMAVGGDEPMRTDTIFRISSMTKPITAVATLALIEDCVLRLDDPIDEWIPELAGRPVLRSIDAAVDDTVPAERSITVRDLLTFRLGHGMVLGGAGPLPIADALADAGLGPGPPEPDGPLDPDEWLRRLGTLPLLHQPGARWLYNTGSDVLGVLLSRVTGRPLASVLTERVLAPLGMKDTGFAVDADQARRLPPSYLTNPGDGSLVPLDPAGGEGRWARPPRFPSGASGLVSTVDDYHVFARMLLDHGASAGGRLLSRPSVLAMISDQLTPAQKGSSNGSGFFDHHGWGFGVGIVTHRHAPYATPGRYGWDGGLGTSFWNDPAEDMVTLLMTQAAWTSAMAPSVCTDFWTAASAAIAD